MQDFSVDDDSPFMKHCISQSWEDEVKKTIQE